MDMDMSDDLRRFQTDVRTFLEDALTPEIREAARLSTTILAEHGITQRWHKILHKQGWAAPGWPVEHGGTGWSPVERYLYATEYARAGAPILSPLGLAMVGPAIMGHGSDAQKAFYLPRILSGEDVWCQGYSEPGAGSDLASLQCRTVVDGDGDDDDYIVNGAKTWTTNAHNANRMFCLVRTNSEGKPQTGITFILLEMDTPGITVAPIHILGGDHEFNQVFFDDVRVPCAGRVGAEDDGWTVAKYLLEFERGFAAAAAPLRARLTDIRGMAARRRSGGDRLLDEPAFSRSLAALEIELTSVEYTEHRSMAEMALRGSPGPASPMLKTRATDVQMAISELALEAIAYYAAPHQPEERLAGANLPPIGERDEMSITARYLNDRAVAIYGGSNEIQRNIMAKLVLGM